MDKSNYNINIIGAGVAGLVAARVLEEKGYSPVIYEASDRVGGRVKTDIVKGYQLDHGFQVLLSAYPMVKRYLDLDELDVQKLMPGSIIYKNGKQHKIGDPLRSFSFLLPTLFSSVGTFKDKLKIFKLTRSMKAKSIDEVFKLKEISTLDFLKDYGFSDSIISNFFKPFFTGIFLEPNLETSSRLFCFIFKMFAEGYAVIPKGGMEEIPKQLSRKLTKTKVHFNVKVDQVKEGKIILNDIDEIESHATIIATEASQLVSNLKNQQTQWKSCDNLYFEVGSNVLNDPIIGLIADESTLINNIFYATSILNKTKGSKELLSVSVIKHHDLSEAELVKEVTEELKSYCKIEGIHYLRSYHIHKALPNVTNVVGDIDPTETQLTETIFLAGDQLINGSLNAAMRSGEQAAYGAINAIEGKLIEH